MHCTLESHESVADCIRDMHFSHDVTTKAYLNEPLPPEDYLSPDEPIENIPCLFLRIKKYIVKLRRRTGNVEIAWTNFKKDIDDNIECICQHLPIRWLTSIVDTYITYGDEIEKRNAMLISLMVNWEKMWNTVNYHNNTDNSTPYDGMYIPKLNEFTNPNEDAFIEHVDRSSPTRRNLLIRLYRCLGEDPALNQMFNKILDDFMKWNGFVINRFDAVHDLDIKSEIIETRERIQKHADTRSAKFL